MSMYKNLTTFAAVAVLGLGLAACGGGGGSSPTTSTDAGGTGGGGMGMDQKGPDIAALLVTAQNARTGAENAQKAGAKAVVDAAKYSTMYSTAAALGDSMTAQANAQKVLDAKGAADQAVKDAQAAKMAAEEALTAAEGIPADDPQRAAVMTAIQGAIDAADDAIKAAMKSADNDDLIEDYEAVIVDKMKPKGASYHGEQVAMAVGGALMPTADGGGTRHTHASDTTSPDFSHGCCIGAPDLGICFL